MGGAGAVSEDADAVTADDGPPVEPAAGGSAIVCPPGYAAGEAFEVLGAAPVPASAGSALVGIPGADGVVDGEEPGMVLPG